MVILVDSTPGGPGIRILPQRSITFPLDNLRMPASFLQNEILYTSEGFLGTYKVDSHQTLQLRAKWSRWLNIETFALIGEPRIQEWWFSPVLYSTINIEGHYVLPLFPVVRPCGPSGLQQDFLIVHHDNQELLIIETANKFTASICNVCGSNATR